MGSRGPITPALVRALQRMRAGDPLRGGEIVAARHGVGLELCTLAAGAIGGTGWDLTLSGELVLAAYRLGRSRWGAT